MNEFLTLFKYELKMQMPFFKRRGKDAIGNLLMLLLTAFIVYVAVVFLSKIMQNYISVEIDKVYSPIERASEMLNVLYIALMGVMIILTLERTRKVFTDDKNKMVFLRLPVSRKNVFLSKFVVLALRVYFFFTICILTINATLSTLIAVDFKFWLSTVGTCVFMPLVCLFVVGLLIVPYIRLINALSNKYMLLFFLFSGILVACFILYSGMLSVVQTLLTTGSIRFLFNGKFVSVLQSLYTYCYPANLFTAIIFGKDLIASWLMILAFSALSFVVICIMSKKLYSATFYTQERNKIKFRKPKTAKMLSPLKALVKKEAICILRQPKHLFSYVSVAVSMPIMVYCCFTLFETLIYNVLGVRVNFALALIVVTLFGVLTNTFCSTNITREGLGLLKIKTLPIRASKLFSSKIIFCGLISSVAVLVSCVLLVVLSSLSLFDGFCCTAIGIVFTFAQILVATRLDLNHAKISLSELEVEKQSGRTILKVMFIGASLSIISGICALFFAFFANGLGLKASAELLNAVAYLLPVAFSLIYLTIAIFYYRNKIMQSFENLTC